MTDFTTWNAGGETIAIRKDLRVPMRDGVELAAYAYIREPTTRRAPRWWR